MDDLIAFVTARLDEREHFAKIARLAQKHREQMLREAEAMRAILAGHMPAEDDPVLVAAFTERFGPYRPKCRTCAVTSGASLFPRDWPCPTARHLAGIWNDHPEYRPEWKP